MIRQGNPNFKASRFAPNPLEVTYWIDLTADPNGGTIKTYNGSDWYPINENNVDIPVVTADANGLMSSAMFTKLNGIEAQANKYVLPEATTSTIGGVRKGAAVNNLAADADIATVVAKVNALLDSLRTAKIIDTPAS